MKELVETVIVQHYYTPWSQLLSEVPLLLHSSKRSDPSKLELLCLDDLYVMKPAKMLSLFLKQPCLYFQNFIIYFRIQNFEFFN